LVDVANFAFQYLVGATPRFQVERVRERLNIVRIDGVHLGYEFEDLAQLGRKTRNIAIANFDTREPRYRPNLIVTYRHSVSVIY
jgi:hypothetical protein